MSKIYLVNQQFVNSDVASIHPSDLGIIRGYSVFDFFRVSEGKALFLDDYLNRFYDSAAGLRLVIKLSKQELRSKIVELINLNGLTVAGVRMILTGGVSSDYFTPTKDSTLVVMVEDFNYPNPDKYANGATLISTEFQRLLPEIKSTNYLLPIFDIPNWKDQGAEEILYRYQGLVYEASRSNIFMVKDNVVITNQMGVLWGITRKKVIELAQKHYKVEIRDITFKELLKSDEVFITSTTKKVMPIVKIDNEIIKKGQPGEVSHHLIQLFNDFEKAQTL